MRLKGGLERKGRREIICLRQSMRAAEEMLTDAYLLKCFIFSLLIDCVGNERITDLNVFISPRRTLLNKQKRKLQIALTRTDKRDFNYLFLQDIPLTSWISRRS